MYRFILILFVAAGFIAPVSAHHSRAVFDLDKLVELEGVVAEIKWGNPHMWVYLDVADATGKLERWGVEGPGASAAVASGISPARLKVGARVIFKAHPGKDASKRIADMQTVVIDGQTYYARGAIIQGTESER